MVVAGAVAVAYSVVNSGVMDYFGIGMGLAYKTGMTGDDGQRESEDGGGEMRIEIRYTQWCRAYGCHVEKSYVYYSRRPPTTVRGAERVLRRAGIKGATVTTWDAIGC